MPPGGRARRRERSRPPEAVLFDMDGTLIDSEPLWFAAEGAILAEYGFELGPEHLAHVLGKPNEVAVGHLLAVSGVPLTAAGLNARIEAAMAETLARGVELIAGAKELLTELADAGVPVALVSASSRRIIEACLGSLGGDRFHVTVSGDDVERGKPHPEPYLRAAALLGADPARCAVIEDSPTGVRSGAAAGCRVVAVPQALPVDPHPLVTVVTSLTGISLGFLGALFEPSLG